VRVSDEDTAVIAAYAPPRQRAALRTWVQACGIRQRDAVAPLPELLALTTLAERNALYEQHAPALGARVAQRALDAASMEPTDVEALIVATSTGIVVPTLDARVAEGLGLPAHATGLTMDGTGCAGAVRGMGLAPRFLAEGSRGAVLVVAVELCSLWLQTDEPSPYDVQANLVFGDGAAAAVLTRNTSAAYPELLAHRSVRWPDSVEMRGARLTHTGFRHHTSPHLVRLLARHLRSDVEEFVAAAGLARQDVALTLVNPSDPAISRAAARLLEVSEKSARVGADVWANHGNTLAVGPLHLLSRVADCDLEDGAHVLVVVLGPGITCELLLIRWRGGLPVRHGDGAGARRNLNGTAR
jgi:alkylresorcinol/alkylpyrone synthase